MATVAADPPIPLIAKVNFDDQFKHIEYARDDGKIEKVTAMYCNGKDPELLLRTVINHKEIAKLLSIEDKPAKLRQTFRQMLAPGYQDTFGTVCEGRTINTAQRFEDAVKLWLKIYIKPDKVLNEERTYLMTCLKPFKMTTTEMWQRLLYINGQLLPLLPTDEITGDENIKFSGQQIHAFLYTKQPEKFRLKFDEQHNRVYTSYTSAELATYFDDQQDQEWREREARKVQGQRIWHRGGGQRDNQRGRNQSNQGRFQRGGGQGRGSGNQRQSRGGNQGRGRGSQERGSELC